MRKYFKLSMLVLLALTISACIDKDQYINNGSEDNSESTESTVIDTNFSFQTRQSVQVSLTAINEVGQNGVGVLFSIYTQNPFIGEDNERNPALLPLYQGYTNNSGRLSTSLSVPLGSETLYIIPEISGYGFMQEVAVDAAYNLVFKGRQVSSAAARSISRADETTERSAIALGNNYKFFHYFTTNELNANTGELNSVSDIVSYEQLSNEFKLTVNNMFPERNNVDSVLQTTDLIVKDESAEVWVTYVGDGGFVNNQNSAIYNGLYYYTYTDENKPSMLYSNDAVIRTDTYQLTCVFPNVHPSYISPGVKVQLLYFDKATNKYVKDFPKGTHIGFMMNYKGFNKDKGMGFSLATYDYAPYASSVAFNRDKTSHGILTWSDVYDCFILGMERQGKHTISNKVGDCDFNDIMAKVVCVAKKQNQVAVARAFQPLTVISSQTGILAFEDGWPKEGDYDFNDFVCKYTYELEKNTDNYVTAIKMTFEPMAIGASNVNGFGIQIPAQASNIASIEGAEVENAGADAAAELIIYNNVREGFNNAGGFINTQATSSFVKSTSKTVYITLKTPQTENETATEIFNPFLFTGSRSQEIHLVDYTPTSKADFTLFGTGDDRSDVNKQLYYRMDNLYPWALDISDVDWQWPLESVTISKGYPKYTSWYTTWKSGMVDWFTDEKVSEYLFKK